MTFDGVGVNDRGVKSSHRRKVPIGCSIFITVLVLLALTGIFITIALLWKEL